MGTPSRPAASQSLPPPPVTAAAHHPSTSSMTPAPGQAAEHLDANSSTADYQHDRHALRSSSHRRRPASRCLVRISPRQAAWDRRCGVRTTRLDFLAAPRHRHVGGPQMRCLLATASRPELTARSDSGATNRNSVGGFRARMTRSCSWLSALPARKHGVFATSQPSSPIDLCERL